MKWNGLIATGIGLFLSVNATAQVDMLIRGGGGGFSRSISVSNENGVKTTRVTENGKKYVIREDEDLIEVEFANTYGPNDMDKLKERHPDLHMHVTSFPKTSGDSSVELTISVKEKIAAETEEELKEKSEAAHKIFQKYTRKNRLGGGPFGKLELRGLELGGPARLIEIEADVAEEVEKMKAKMEEMRKGIRGPLFGRDLKSEKKDSEKVDESKTDAEKADKKSGEKKKKKDDLIKT